MACAKNPSITNFDPKNTYSRPQYNNNVTQYDTNYTQSKCRTIQRGYPSFTPKIFHLSETISSEGQYKVITIIGLNFLPPVYGTTYVNFGTQFKHLPILFYSPSQLSFVVPLNAVAGTYNITVVNIYNSNFSPAVNVTYSGNLNYSNSIPYLVFNMP